MSLVNFVYMNQGGMDTRRVMYPIYSGRDFDGSRNGEDAGSRKERTSEIKPIDFKQLKSDLVCAKEKVYTILKEAQIPN